MRRADGELHAVAVTDSYRAFALEQVAADVKHAVCRVSDAAFDPEENASIPQVTYELPDGQARLDDVGLDGGRGSACAGPRTHTHTLRTRRGGRLAARSPRGRAGPCCSPGTAQSLPNSSFPRQCLQEIQIGAHRFAIPESLFDPGLLKGYGDCLPAGSATPPVALHTLINDAISRCDVDARRELYANALLVGGTAGFATLRERLERELTAIAPAMARIKVGGVGVSGCQTGGATRRVTEGLTSAERGGKAPWRGRIGMRWAGAPCSMTPLATPPSSLPHSGRAQVTSPPNAVERRQSVWIGGSVLASLGSFQQMWLSKAEYEEYGPGLIHKKAP